MADPVIRLKRSAVAGKRPTLANLELGEVALNTYDGNLFTRQDTSGVGIGTTVTLLTPWQESYGGKSISYSGDVGISGKLNILGVTTSQFLSVTGIATISGLKYPSSDGSPNQYLKTDGSGNLSFGTVIESIGLQTSGGFVGSGITTFDFRGSGISTITSPSLGFSTIFIENTPNSITRTITNRTAGAGQTTFASLDYEIGYIDVFLNGVRLSDADYTATDGTTIAISTSLNSGDNLDFISYDRILDSARWSVSSGSGGNDIYNTSLGKVGIATTSPNSTLDVNGSAYILNNLVLGNGYLGIGTDIPSTVIDIYGDGADTTQISLRQWNDNSSNGVDGPDIRFFASGGTIASPLEMDNDDVIGKVNAFAYDGTSTSQYGGFGWRYVTDGLGNRGSLFEIQTKAYGGSNSTKVHISENGNVGISSLIPTSKLTVSGDVLVSGVVTATDFDSTSDFTLKDNIRKISKPISKIEKIRGVTFEWKETGQKAMGVVAQEIEKVLPSLVRGDDIKTVNYNGLIGLLIECVKDQQRQINELKNTIKSL